MKTPTLDRQFFSALAPLMTACALRPPNEVEIQVCRLQAAALEALTDIEQNHPNKAHKVLKEALNHE